MSLIGLPDKTQRALNTVRKEVIATTEDNNQQFIIPNLSGDLSRGKVLTTPTGNQDPANKKYVDDNAGGAPEGTAVKSTGEAGTTKFLRTDGDGTCSWQVPPGTGDVTKVGTPANNQVGVWTGDGTIEGDADLTFDGSNLTTTGTVTWSGGSSTNANTAYTHSQDNTQAHSDYLLNSEADVGVGLTLTGDNSSVDTAYVPMVLYNTDATPPAASGFPIGTIYVQYTP